jgi:endonuclease YncB( thermonuclease family)
MRFPVRRISALAAVCAVLWSSTLGWAAAAGESWDGRIVRVLDGDSLVLRVERVDIPLRLARIDAPEWNQPHGRTAHRVLSGWVLNKRVHVDVVDTDRYDRSVVEMFVDGIHINREMVRNGHAWAYTRYGGSAAVIELEREARAARCGLWELPSGLRQTPFSWRKSRPETRH